MLCCGATIYWLLVYFLTDFFFLTGQFFRRSTLLLCRDDSIKFMWCIFLNIYSSIYLTNDMVKDFVCDDKSPFQFCHFNELHSNQMVYDINQSIHHVDLVLFLFSTGIDCFHSVFSSRLKKLFYSSGYIRFSFATPFSLFLPWTTNLPISRREMKFVLA